MVARGPVGKGGRNVIASEAKQSPTLQTKAPPFGGACSLDIQGLTLATKRSDLNR